MAIRAVVFDFDGVILQSVHIKTRAFAELFAAEGREAQRRLVEYHEANGGISRFEKFRWFYREVLRRPLSEEEAARLGDGFNALVEQAVASCPFVPGAREFLEERRGRLPFFVASGTPEEELGRIVKRRGLSGFFDGIYGAPKRKAVVLRELAARLGCPPSELVMIGDAPNDHAAAREAGASFIGVAVAGAPPFPEGTVVLEDLRELGRTLDGLAEGFEPASRALITSPEEARLPSPSASWVYLGKDAQRRAAAGRRLGAPPEPVAAMLSAEALRLREPFLDLVAGLGRPFEGDPDRAARWHAGTLAWKDPSASDLFLLCCFQGLARRLCSSGRALCVVVEDSWLRRELLGKPPPLAEKARLLFLGLLRRLNWAARILLSRLRLEACGASLPKPLTEPPALLYGHLMRRSLGEGGRWIDHYTPGLAESLRADGVPVLRLVDPSVTGFEPDLAERSAEVVPTLLAADLLDILRAGAAFPPVLPPGAELEGRPLAALLEREWWHDLSRSGRSSYLLLRSAAERLFSRLRPRLLILPFENQPQERMLVLAARRLAIEVVGEQHTTVPRLQPAFFLGRGEAERAPVPHRLRCAGPASLERLAEGGWPRPRLEIGGSRRYPPEPPPPLPAAGRPEDVLVVLPVDRPQARELLLALAGAFPRGGEGFQFVIQPHPSEPMALSSLPLAAEVSTQPLTAGLLRCGRVIACGSTSALEALCAGRALLRFRCDAQLDVDPLEDIGDEDLPTAGPYDLRDKLLSQAPPSEALTRRGRRLWTSLFSPVAGWR